MHVSPICYMQRDTLLMHEEPQVVHYGLEDAVPFLQMSHLKLPALLGKWKLLGESPIQIIP